MQIQVHSETSRLNGVIVHTPGREVSLVHPEIKQELLFDDIIFESQAAKEHRDMLDVFRVAMPKTGKVFEIVDLIVEAFATEEARLFFVEKLIKRHPDRLVLIQYKSALLDLTPIELCNFAIHGVTKDIKVLSLLPSPNILFTRDLAAVLGGHIVLSSAAKVARIRESILMDTLIRFHSLFADIRQNTIRIPDADTIEGGDILIASPDVVLIGMSERTSFSGVMSAGRTILERGFKTVLIVDIPKQRSSMHLDTIFTFCSPNECVAFPPAIMDRSDNVVALTLRNGEVVTNLKSSLHSALEESLERDITFIKCGGDDPVMQHREQWSDGANLFALAPGVVVGYERNVKTFETMQDHGYQTMNQFEFIDKYRDTGFNPKGDEKIAISFLGHELCRGRGGARCMTMPVSRLDS